MQRLSPAADWSADAPSTKQSALTTLDRLRASFHVGMSQDAFFEACDALLEEGPLKMGSPAASMDLISIGVREGGEVLFYLTGGKLTYAEYQGDVFMGE